MRQNAYHFVADSNTTKSEAISLVATAASKLAAVEDVGPKRPETSPTASVKVSPKTRATLQALKLSKSRLNTVTKTFRDVETITEVCGREQLPEVEIISLIKEQIPRYRLRADTLTQFQGYENTDWFIPTTNIVQSEENLQLSPDQIRETLNYFILCSDRVSQMTKTYNDIEAVTRLLEEKEKDLELTARIGKELLSHNQKLETTVQELENELKVANEKITQLSYEVSKKTELIQVLTNDVDESGGSEAGTPTGFRGINLDVMQKKISSLEDENKQLRNEFSKLAHEADNCEEQEARLVKDITNQLANANMEVYGIAEELDRQKEENRLQHEQIINLTAKLSETELRLAQLMSEHDDVSTNLVITKENQNALADELAKFKDRYSEVVNMLAETQEQLRDQRKRSMPVARGGALFPSLAAAPQPDSIALELESSLYSELSLDSGIISDRIPSFKKVFSTIKNASRNSTNSNADGMQFPRIGSMTTSTISSSSLGPRMSSTLQGRSKNARSTFPSLDSTGHSDSEGSLLTDSEDYPAPQQVGVPGIPGAADLEAALRRLTPAEVSARRACLSSGAGYNYDYDTGIHTPPNFIPFGCRTPDSIMSTGSSGNFSGFSGNSSTSWRLPEKLQIIKPMEGSQTLHHWSKLATPTLGGLLEDRPGVKIRGGRALEDLGLEIFTLTDVEEDEEYLNPGKLFQDTGSIYTYTNSTVMHPDDHTIITSSLVSSRVPSEPNSGLNTSVNSGVTTPHTLSRRNSTSTFSTTLGLAKMLNERGIKAVTASCVSTPNGDKNFTPTMTPCNSPDGSPGHSRSASPEPSTSSISFGLLYSGAEFLKRTFSGDTPQNTPRQTEAIRKSRRDNAKQQSNEGKGKEIEKQDWMNMDSITSSSLGMSQLALQGTFYSWRKSPIAQFAYLKNSMSRKVEYEGNSSDSSYVASTVSDDSQSGVSSVSGKSERCQTEDTDNFASTQILSTKFRHSGGARSVTRPDLGQVKQQCQSTGGPGSGGSSIPPIVTKESMAQSTLGTISSLLFGRKGGLL
ncbi:PREDICTED: trafficking kinesin-binding protein milt isoform X2 [Ceratosolen solmsi marchali]|uniref:Trafficking kinesin-binding protein milt isoform X2 n=1 Tax=Ceratosolen solmsi marchali TaxID=326594 RepID=A0AAJ6YX39_9HYME|nr:PREDICTED: trafficking kinesin-binding protein milt isoform X2 [Ceratosolen solmsi marchali]